MSDLSLSDSSTQSYATTSPLPENENAARHERILSAKKTGMRVLCRSRALRSIDDNSPGPPRMLPGKRSSNKSFIHAE